MSAHPAPWQQGWAVGAQDTLQSQARGPGPSAEEELNKEKASTRATGSEEETPCDTLPL